MVEGTRGRIFEMTDRSQMVWEYVNPIWGSSDEIGENNYICSAYRYGLADDGLKNCLGIKTRWRTWRQVALETYIRTDKRKKSSMAETKPSSTQADAVKSRLESLGY